MKAFFSALSRNVGTLLLSLAIVAGLSYYLLSYVPQKTSSLNARYFRVLARIGENVKDKIEAQHLNDEGDASSIGYLMYNSRGLDSVWRSIHPRSGARPPSYGGRKFVQDANNIFLDQAGPESYRLVALDTTKAPEPAAKYSLALQANQLVFGYTVPPEPNHAPNYELTHAGCVDSLVRELSRPDVFDYFFVVDLAGRSLLYSSGPTDMYLNTAGAAQAKPGKLPYWLADSSLAHTGRASTLAFGGQEHRLFAQPVRLASGLTCLLVGGVPATRFDAERRALPAGWPELVLGVLLLSVLALPFLKLRLLSLREQIQPLDVLACAASLVLGSGVLLLTLQAAVSRHEMEHRVITRQLADLAKDVTTDLHKELVQLNTIARQVDSTLMAKPSSEIPRPGPSGSLTEIRNAYPNSAYMTRGYLEEDYITWITKDGQAVYGLDYRSLLEAKERNKLSPLNHNLLNHLPSLAGRRYLQKIRAGDYQQISGDNYLPASTTQRMPTTQMLLKPAKNLPLDSIVTTHVSTPTDSCFFDMLRTVQNTSLGLNAAHKRTASHEQKHLQAVLARPSRWSDTLICAFETRLLCFDNGIIPPGYGFCLVERNGDVMAHFNPSLNLSENLLTDCEPASQLQAVLYAQVPLSIEVVYQGKPMMLYVRPLAGMQRYLVTFFDMRYAKAQQSQTSLLAFTLLCGFWLLCAAFMLLRWLVVPRSPRAHTSRTRFQNLWPHPTYAARYWHVVVGQGLGLLAFGVVATRVGPVSQLYLLVIVPLLLYVLTYHHTRLRLDYCPRIHSWVVGVAAVGLALLLLSYLRLVGGHEALWVVGLALGLGALVRWLMHGSLARWLDRRHHPTRAYRPAYVAMLLGWVGLLGIVPALSCYRIAQLAERLQQVRYGQVSMLKAYENYEIRRQDIDYQPNIFHYYCKFFFKSAFAEVEASKTDTYFNPDYSFHYFSLPHKNSLFNEICVKGDGYPADYYLLNSEYSEDVSPADYHPDHRLTRHPEVGEQVHFNLDKPIAPAAAAPAATHPGYGWPERAALRIFTALGAGTINPGGEASNVLALDSTENAHWHPWGVSALVGDSLTLTTQHNTLLTQSDTNGGWVSSRFEGLQVGNPLGWPAARWGLLGLVAGLVLVLWWLIQYLLRRLFGLTGDLAAGSPLAAPLPPAAPAHRFWLLPAGSTWADVPAWAQQALAPVEQVLDCRQLFGAPAAAGPAPDTRLAEALAAVPDFPVATAAGRPVIVVASFDYRLAEASLTQDKIQLLNELQQRGWPLVVLSASHPEAFGDCGHPMEKPCPDKDHHPRRETGERLLDTLAEFWVEYFALQNAAPLAVPSLAEKEIELFGNDRSLRRFFERECQASPFVAGLRPTLVATLWQQRQPGRLLTRPAIVAAVLQLAQFHFRRLWLALSPQERFLLFDLAQDGLVNTDNRRVLSTLLHKGFLRLTGNKRLSLSSASFRSFILTAQRPHEAMRYVVESEQGSWAAARTPLLLLLVAGALFMFTTQPTAFTQTQGFLLGLAGLLPALVELVKFMLTPKSTLNSAVK